ncbi:MAG: DUF3987 domain-containing protein [Terrimicrobiaceae bacterium]
MLEEIKALAEAGASLIWLHEREKRPIGTDWSSKPMPPWAQFKKTYREGNNVGVLLGEPSRMDDGLYLHCVDMDIRDPKKAKEALAKLKEMFPGVVFKFFPTVKSGSGGESRHFYFGALKSYSSKKLAHSGEKIQDRNGRWHWTWEIELFGTGKQTVLPPSIHPDTGFAYEWLFEPDFVIGFPTIDTELLDSFFEEPENDGEYETGPVGLTYEEVREIVLDLPHEYCEDRNLWRDTGMAIKHELGEAGRPIWDEFSKRSEKYDPKVQEATWKSFKGKTRRPITIRSSMQAARMERIKAEFFADDEPQRNGEGIPDISILRQSVAPAPLFPIDVFGPIWKKKIEAMARNAGAPVDYVAAAGLTISSGLIGNARWVQAHKEWKEPPVLWSVGIGLPSANKSPAFGKLAAAVGEIEKMWRGPYAEQKKQWEARKRAADSLRKRWEAACSKAMEAGNEPPKMPSACEIGPKPQRRRVMLTDTTIEALTRILGANPRGVLLFRDELSAWFANLSRYSNGSDRPIWLEAYGGRFYVVDRKSDDEPCQIERFSVAILGGIQPDRLDDMLAGQDDGLIPRFLPYWPEAEGMDFVRDPEDVDRLTEALRRLTELMPNSDGSPVLMPLSERATDIFEAWKNGRARSDRFLSSRVKAAFGKADGHVIRLAINIELIKWAGDEFVEDPPTEIGSESMQAAIRLREEYFKPMQLRVFGHSLLVPEIKAAKMIAEWIVENKIKHFNGSQMRRGAGIKGIHSSTNAELIDAALSHLAALNWIEPAVVKSQAGGRPPKNYQVNEKLWECLEES